MRYLKFLFTPLVLLLFCPQVFPQRRVWDVANQEKLIRQNKMEFRELSGVKARANLQGTNQKVYVKKQSNKLRDVLDTVKKRVALVGSIVNMVMDGKEAGELILDIAGYQQQALALVSGDPQLAFAVLKNQKAVVKRTKRLSDRLIIGVLAPDIKLGARKMMFKEIVRELYTLRGEAYQLIVKLRWYARTGGSWEMHDFKQDDKLKREEIVRQWEILMND